MNCGKCGKSLRIINGAVIPTWYAYESKKKGWCHRICPRRKHKPMKMGKRRPAKRPQGQRGFKRSSVYTKARNFLDRRSHVGLDREGNPHDILYGEDLSVRRAEVFDRDGGICRKTGVYVGWEAGEMDHIENEAGKRCDCMVNLQWITKAEHIAEHPEKQTQLRSIPNVHPV